MVSGWRVWVPQPYAGGVITDVIWGKEVFCTGSVCAAFIHVLPAIPGAFATYCPGKGAACCGSEGLDLL